MTENHYVSHLKKWVFATKLNSWPKILLPALLGQSIGFISAGSFNGPGLIAGLGFSFFGLIYIVLLNDFGDQFVDRVKRKMFPRQCSPKTIPDRILPASALLKGGQLMGGLALAWSLSGLLIDRPWLPALALGGLFIFFSYTFPPLKLNYRGGGELLEGFGVGFYLPYLNIYCQTGKLWHPDYLLLSGFVVLSLSSALASGLSDEESDLTGGKKTFTTMFGNPMVRNVVVACLLVTPVVWLWSLSKWPTVPVWFCLVPGLLVWAMVVPIKKLSAFAGTRQFKEQKQFKNLLHLGIWGSLVVWIFEVTGYLYFVV